MASLQPTAAPLADDPAGRGTMLGRYEVLSKLAAGGMATVYLARAVGLAGFERTVAIKCCHPHLQDDPRFVAMFLDEARLAARIHHPNVVATLDVADAPRLHLVMEYVAGATLGALIGRAYARDGGCIPRDVALRIACDALAGLEAAHRLTGPDGAPLRLVHRDVSPQNILVGSDGLARVTDFGIARAEQRLAETRAGEVRGKFGYMPPEQLASRAIDARADVYAAGVVLWESLTGRRLFSGANDAAVIARAQRGAGRAPSELEPGVPAALDAVVMRALALEPAARFESAAAFALAIEACGAPIATTRAVAAWVTGALAEPPAAPPAPFTDTARTDPDPTRALAPQPAPGVSRGPRRARAGLAAVGLAVVAAATWALVVHARAPSVAVAVASPAPRPAVVAPPAVVVAPPAPRAIRDAPASPIVAVEHSNAPRDTVIPIRHHRAPLRHGAAHRFVPGAI